MCFWGRIIGVFFVAPLVAGSTDTYLPAVGPAPLSFAQPPPPLSQLAWRLPLPSACIDVSAEKKKTDSTALATPVSPEAARNAASVASGVPSSSAAARETAANAFATAGGSSSGRTPRSSAFASANQGEEAIRSQSSPQPVPLSGPQVGGGGNDSQTTAFALMQYFQPGHARKGTTDLIVPVPVGFVPPTPARTTPSSTATYLSP